MSRKITIEAAANELGVSRRSVRRLITSGQLRAFKIGRGSLIRIDRDDLASVIHPVVPNGKD
jgi:excisionase family DNA binding protein